jgi:hypothetical protein
LRRGVVHRHSAQIILEVHLGTSTGLRLLRGLRSRLGRRAEEGPRTLRGRGGGGRRIAAGPTQRHIHKVPESGPGLLRSRRRKLPREVRIIL